MQEEQLPVGQVVFSRSGRDAGRFYVVYQVLDEQYVMLVDGAHRRMEKPKKKKRKHLKLCSECFLDFQKKLGSDQLKLDAEVRGFLKQCDLEHKYHQKEA